MATENKRLQTRLMLKYDTYANWTTNNPNLLKGEVAIAVIDVADNTQTHSGQAVPQLLMKVGNGLEGEAGKYNSLPFVSGLAADVHSWAKKADKPSYAINEISGAKEYQVVKAKKTVDGVEVDDEFKYILQSRKAESSDAWTDVSTIDMAKIEARIAAIEGRMTTAEGKITTLEGTVGDSTKGLVKDVADLKALMGEDGEGSVADKITDAINALDATKTQTAGADGLALEIVQENGAITSISGSIAANTYDAYGAADAAVKALDATVKHEKGTDGLAIEITQVDGKLTSVTASIAAETYDAYGAASAAVEALDMTAPVEGTQEGTVIKFIDKVNQTNGLVEAELGELVFNSAYNASTNKAATMSDITETMANLNGAMRFKGVEESIPTDNTGYVGGDVIIVGIKEYVFDGSNWIELGDEGALAAAIAGLKGNSTGAASKTVTAHVQASGVVELTYEDIAIAESQVAGLTKKLSDMQGEIDAEEERAAKAEKVNADAIAVIEGNDKGSSMRAVAEDVANAGLNSLNSEKTLAADETVLVAKQANGAVSVTSQKIQLSAIDQVTGLQDALDLKATEADLTLAENRIKANEDAIAKLNDADTVVGSVANSIKTAIEGLDKADTAIAGQFVTAVSEDNGVITVSRGAVNVKDLEQTADTYVVFDCGSSSVNI